MDPENQPQPESPAPEPEPGPAPEAAPEPEPQADEREADEARRARLDAVRVEGRPEQRMALEQGGFPETRVEGPATPPSRVRTTHP